MEENKNLGYCPFKRGVGNKDKPCNEHCALFIKGLNRCVFVGMNMNLSKR